AAARLAQCGRAGCQAAGVEGVGDRAVDRHAAGAGEVDVELSAGLTGRKEDSAAKRDTAGARHPEVLVSITIDDVREGQVVRSVESAPGTAGDSQRAAR